MINSKQALHLLLVLSVLLRCCISTPLARQYAAPPALQGTYDTRPPKLRNGPFRGVFEWVYPFYARPQYRYPFYDNQGNGELLYGYGGNKLYKYTVFQPVEGYYRR